MDDQDEDYFLPLEDQRVFGAGIKRKRIAFVPASTSESVSSLPTPTPGNVGGRYLSIVLKSKPDSSQITNTPEEEKHTLPGSECPICKQRISDSATKAALDVHESSVAHQVCLEHSHPPSHLDRDHVGLRYLAGYGWDPDSRKGLGVRQEGIQVPVKAKEKRDTAGLGIGNRDEDNDPSKSKRRPKVAEQNRQFLNAKQVKLKDLENRRKAENLRQSFYGEDLSQYLGSAT